MFKSILLLLFLATITTSQVIQSGACPSVKAKLNFRPARFAGTWYTIKQIPNAYESIAKCPSIKYTWNNKAKTFTITQNQIRLYDNATMSWEGEGKLINGSAVGSWHWTSPKLQLPLNTLKVPYQVINTDYINWTVLYSCIEIGTSHLEQMWVLTKKFPQEYPVKVEEKGIAAIKAAKLDVSTLIPVVNSVCPTQL